jgi:hypothetical protein
MRLKLMAGLIAVVALTGATSECQISQDINSLEVIAAGSVSASQVYTATNIYVAAAGTARQYLALPLCPQAAPLCRTQPVAQAVYSNLLAADKAVRQLDAYVDANPGQAVPVSYYNVLVTALQTMNALVKANTSAVAAAN